MPKNIVIVSGAVLALLLLVRVTLPARHVAHAGASPQAGAAATPEAIDRLTAPIALYPDQLLGQILICAQNPGTVDTLHLWLGKNATLKGTELQDAAAKQGFDPSCVALVLFPQVVKTMADQLDWTTDLGVAFTADRSAVFASIQRLRKRANDLGTLKTTPQQEVDTRTTSGGDQVIVIEPANPQVVYVPQYNSTTIYTQAPPTTVVVQSTSSADAAAAGMIGFTAGIVIGAAVSNPYYYGPYGARGGAYMYNDAWDDYYDAREDAREDWSDHREDLADERGDRAENSQEQRTDRQENRGDTRSDTQGQRTDRQQNRQENGTASQAATQRTANSGNAEARGYSRGADQQTRERTAAKSDAFSGYSSGKSERSASQRGGASRSSSGRSRGGGGGRRR
jgi:Skp family chaperone for outer membrane proteins